MDFLRYTCALQYFKSLLLPWEKLGDKSHSERTGLPLPLFCCRFALFTFSLSSCISELHFVSPLSWFAMCSCVSRSDCRLCNAGACHDKARAKWRQGPCERAATGGKSPGPKRIVSRLAVLFHICVLLLVLLSPQLLRSRRPPVPSSALMHSQKHVARPAKRRTRMPAREPLVAQKQFHKSSHLG